MPHKYLEEDLLHIFIIDYKYHDVNIFLDKIEKILYYVNSWEVSDTINCKLLKKYPDITLTKIKDFLCSDCEYKIRFALVCLIKNYLDIYFDKDIFNYINNIKVNTYYVNMAVAWYYSCALVMQYDDTISLFRDRKLDKFIHNKSIDKAIDSYRIDDEKKKYLKSLKIGR